MKKHYFYNMLTILMVALTSFSFASCGDDDDDEQGGGSGSQNVLVGSWRMSWEWKRTEPTSGYHTWTFNNDGTGSHSGVNQTYDDNGKKNGSPLTWNDSFTYELIEYNSYYQTGAFIYSWDSAPSKYYTKYFELDGNKLKMEGGRDIYIKQ